MHGNVNQEEAGSAQGAVACVIVASPDRGYEAQALIAALRDAAGVGVILVATERDDGLAALADGRWGESDPLRPGGVLLAAGDAPSGKEDAPLPSAGPDAVLAAVARAQGSACVAVLATSGEAFPVGTQAVEALGGLVLYLEESPPGTDRSAVLPSPRALADAVRLFARATMQEDVPPRVDAADLPRACEAVRAVTGHDLKHYKTTTLSRRIERRMNVLRLESSATYLDRLEAEPEEARFLLREMLIGVTSFFRDKAAFDALAEKALRPLIGEGGPREVRVWVTGQEAYSVAMLLTEMIEAAGSKQAAQVFATDLDERALAAARKGEYPAAASQEIGRERTERFFERSDGRLKVSRELRQKVVFSVHNLIGDPPFSRMDVISCRNVLIYLGPHLQKKLMSVFHYALRPGGFLFLGSSESVASHGDLFAVVDGKSRLAQRRETVIRDPGVGRAEGVPAPAFAPVEASAGADLGSVAQRILLDEFAPPYAVVHEGGAIQYLSAGAEAFLRPPEGEFVNNVLRMARGGLRVGLRAAWSEAQKTRRRATHEGLSVYADGTRRRTRITVQPMPLLGEAANRYMVVFADLGEARPAEEAGPPGPAAEAMVEQLERELLSTREELERAVQDLEAANEELKSSNEELRSMNEEMRSANEELESAKEEVERSADALGDANADLLNLLRSTEIATVFLDAEGRVRNMTPSLSDLYNIREADEGRPLSDFTHRFADLPSPPALSGEGGYAEDELRHRDGRTFMRRVLPYKGEGGGGQVVTFVDVSEQKATRDELAKTLAELETIYQHAPVGLCLLDRDLRYVRINEALAEINGVPAADHPGRTVQEVVPGVSEQTLAAYRLVLETGAVVGPVEITGNTPAQPGVERTWLATFMPAKDKDGGVVGASLSVQEITERKAAEKAIAESEAELQQTLDGVFVLIGLLDAEGRVRFINATAMDALDEGFDEIEAKPFWETPWWDVSEAARDHVRELVERAAAGEVVREDLQWRSTADGSVRWVDFTLAAVRDEAGAVVGLVPSGADITERKEAEERLALALEVGGALGVWSWDLVSNLVSGDARLAKGLGLTEAEMKAGVSPERLAALVHPEDREGYDRAFRRAVETGEPLEAEYRVSDGEREVWVLSRGGVLPGEDGTPARLSGMTIDITKIKEAEEHRRFLMDELNHRVKNTLAVVQSLARQTFGGEGVPRELQQVFSGRLQALAAAHGILTEQSWREADLATVIREATAPCGAAADRFDLNGPKVALAPNQAVALSMAVHELCTNAVKYGALSSEEGRVGVRWTVEADRFELRWEEHDGPPVTPPERKGFGSVMIERMLATDFRGKTEVAFEPDGLRLTLKGRLARR